jgi:hypothetical protein
MTTKFSKQREQLESEYKRLTEEMSQSKSAASNAEDQREGSPYGKREEAA